jgi:hypothetical protein
VKAPPPSPTPDIATVAALPPVDPVRYTSADEADRLVRLDAEEVASLGARRLRLDRLGAQQRELQEHQWDQGLAGLSVLRTALEPTSHPAIACGRG